MEVWRDGRAVARGRNLRVLADYRRRAGVSACYAARNGSLVACFSDGAAAIVPFASDAVLRGWIAARVRASRGSIVNPGVTGVPEWIKARIGGAP